MATLFFSVDADYTKVVQLREEINKLQATMSRFNATTSINQITEYERRLASAKAQLSSMISTAAQTGVSFQTSLVTEINRSRSAFNGLNTDMRNTKGELSALGRGIGGFVQQFTAAALAVKGLQMAVGALKGASDTIIDFQAANSMLRAVMGESEEGLLELRNRAEDLGRTTVFTASQVTQLEIALAKLGFQRDQILDMSGPILQYAQATGANLDDAASNAGAALRMFGAESSEVTRYVGAMSAAINSSALNFQAVSDNLATFGPVAKSVGLNIEESLALFGKLKDAGYEGSTAATSVRNILNELAGGKLSKELGYTVNSFEGVLKALDDLEARGYSGTSAVGKAMKAVGKRGGAQLLTLIQQKDGLRELYQRIQEGESGMGNLAQTMNNNVAGSIKLLQSAWEGFVLSFSNSTGFMAQLIGKVTDGINGMTNLLSQGSGRIGMDEMNDLIGIVVGLTTAFAVYKAELIGVEAIEKVRAAIGATEYARYQQLVAQLEQVTAAETQELSVGLKSAVQKGVLTKEQAQYIASLQATVKAQYDSLQAQLAKAKAEEADAIALEANMRAEQQKAMVELANARATGNATKINAAQKRLLQANTDLQTASEIRNTAATNVNTISKKASATGAALDAAAKQTDTVATWSLTGAIEALSSSMASCPLIWIALAVGALAYGIYKLSTMTDTAAAAQDTLNKSLKDYESELNNAKGEAEEWIRVMEDNTATALQQVEAYEKLKKAYSEFGNYTPEEIKNMSKEERDAIMNRSNEEKEEEYLRKRAKLYQEILKLYENNPLTASDKDEDDLIKELDVSDELAKRLKAELDSVREASNDVRPVISTLIKSSKSAFNDFVKSRNNANMAKALEGISNVREVSLAKEELEKYKETLAKVLDMGRRDSSALQGQTNDSKALLNDLDQQKAEMEKRKALLNDSIYKETDKARKDELKRQKEDIDAIIGFYDTLSESVKNGGAGVAEALKAYSDSMKGLAVSSDVAIVIGDAYQNAMNAMGELTKEQQNNGKVSEESSKKSKQAVTDEVKHIQSKIEELEKALKDPKLSEAKKQQVKIDLANSRQALKDVKSLLGDIDKAVKEKSHFQVIIDFITRFFEDNGTKRVNKKGSRTYTTKGQRKSISYESYEESIEEKNGKRWKTTTYFLSDGSTQKVTELMQDDRLSRAKKGISRGNAAKANKNKADEPNKGGGDDYDNKRLQAERKQASAEDKKYQDELKRQRDLEDAKMKIRKADIDKTEEGVEKSIALAKYQHDKTLLDLKRAEEDKRNELYKTAKAQWEAINEGTFKGDRNSYQLSSEERESFVKQAEVADKTYSDAVKNAYKDYDPTVEKTRKEERYARDILVLQKELDNARSKGNSEDIAFWMRRLKYAQELKDKLADSSMDAFFAKYGTWDDKMHATNNIYARKVSEAQNDPNKGEGDIMMIRREWEETLSSINMDILKDSINWEAVFGDLDKVSIQHLKMLKSNLREYLGKDLTVEQYKDIAQAIDNINKSLEERQGKWAGLFKIANPYFERLKQAREDSKAASDNYDAQLEKLARLKLDKDSKRLAINEKLGKTGAITDNTSSEQFQQMLSKADPEAVASLEGMFDEFKQLLEKIGVQTNVTGNAKKDKEQKDEAEKVLGKDTKKKLEGFGDTLDLVNANMQGLNDLMETLGVDMDSKLAKGVQSLAESTSHASSAVKDLQSLNFTGALNESLLAVGSLGNALGSFGVKGFGDSDPDLKRDLEHLAHSNQDLEKAISNLTDELSKSDTKNATMLYTQTKEYIEETIRNTQEAMQRTQRAHNSGFLGIGGKHSSGKKINDSLSRRDWERISKVAGVSVYNATEFFNLTSEQMANVAMYATDLWTKIKEAGQSGKENVSQYMEEYIEYYRKLEEIEDKYIEKMTTMSFDNLKDDFRSLLSNMDSSVDSFTESFEEKMRNVVINTMLDKVFENRLKTWQKNLAHAVEGGNLKDMKDELKAEYVGMGKEYLEMRKELFSELGIDDSSASQTSSTRSVGNMTQDTAEEIAGRMAAIQMSLGEMSLNNSKLDIPLSQLNESMIKQVTQTMDMRGIADETREYIVLSYLELQGINANTAEMAALMKKLVKTTDKVRDNTQNI